jgi:hypothetical protein
MDAMLITLLAETGEVVCSSIFTYVIIVNLYKSEPFRAILSNTL